MEDKIKQLVEGVIKDAKELGADVKVVEIKNQKNKEQYIHLNFEDDGVDAEIKNCDAASMFLTINYLVESINKQTDLSVCKIYELAKSAHVIFKESMVSEDNKDVN